MPAGAVLVLCALLGLFGLSIGISHHLSHKRKLEEALPLVIVSVLILVGTVWTITVAAS